MPAAPQVGGVEFDGDRLSITYLHPDSDIRNKGLVMQTHNLVVLRSPAYDDLIEAVEDAVTALLNEALDDYHDTEAVTGPDPDEPDEDDDDD